MGYGDPYHKHPLRNVKLDHIPDCCHCKLPITTGIIIGCTRCDYSIHSFCNDLPHTWWNPFHDQHPLTLSTLPFSNSPNLCDGCREPCLDGFTYQCPTCQFIMHLKCFFTIYHVKHEHPLIFNQYPIHTDSPPDCGICGLLVEGFAFSCTRCNFSIHHECFLIPPKVKHHHVHELVYKGDFPEECKQVYCDRCEDKDGKEMDRALCYYYCKRCDYIAHVGCVTEPKKDAVLYKRFTHEHPLRLSRNLSVSTIDGGDATRNSVLCRYSFHCDECNYVVDEWADEFPSLIKHPCHPEHDLTFVEDNKSFKCTVCEFILGYDAALKFAHPLCKTKNLRFSTCNLLFRCNACGELGKGSRIDNEGARDFDLHLECFALLGKLDHESHPDHPLYLCSDPNKILLYNASTPQNCDVCKEEIDPELWIYFCREGDFVAHLNCVASDLLLTLRSFIKNQPDFCAIVEPDKTSFEFQIAEIEVPEPIPLSPPGGVWNVSGWPPPFLRKSQIPIEFGESDDDKEENCDLAVLEELDDVLHCPKCKLLISTEAKYSYIENWGSSHYAYYMKNGIAPENCNTPLQSEPLSLLNEQTIDELYCPICSLLIFPPTYSCNLCQIFFHKSCAEMPRKCPSVGGFYYVLVAPPFCNSLSNCSKCKYPITGYAYLLSTNEYILDTQCALRAPLLNQMMNHKHTVVSGRLLEGTLMCRACGNCIEEGTILAGCPRNYCKYYLHVKCALLPPIIKHRIHKHPLGLATDLAMLDDEYICDVCEKALNPNLWAYRCLDTCGGYATSHVTCAISSKKKQHFRYDQECQNMNEEQKMEFQKKAKLRGIR